MIAQLRFRRRRGESAFTYLEVLIVVVIVGILGLLATPALHSSLVSARLSGAADEVAVALDYARFSAVSTGGKFRVTLDAESIHMLFLLAMLMVLYGIYKEIQKMNV